MNDGIGALKIMSCGEGICGDEESWDGELSLEPGLWDGVIWVEEVL